MACVTEIYGGGPMRNGDGLSSGLKGFARAAVFATAGVVAAGVATAALGMLPTVIPSFAPSAPVMHRVPSAMPDMLVVVDQSREPARRMRQSFIAAYTADSAYSNLDWRRNGTSGSEPVIADIGPDSVIEDKPVQTASLVEPRSDRVRRPDAGTTLAAAAPQPAGSPGGSPALGYAEATTMVPAAVVALSKLQPLAKNGDGNDSDGAANPTLPVGNAIPVPQPSPDAKSALADDDDSDDGDSNGLLLPDGVPLPGERPRLRAARTELPRTETARIEPVVRPAAPAPVPAAPVRTSLFGKASTPAPQARTQLAYAPQSGDTDSSPQSRLFGSTFTRHRDRVAIYDISAATVYMPNGERLEAHSGMGYMRDNPRYVNQKNRGPTPPHTYDLRLRESRFHGVQAIRLTPVDGANLYNRDGLLAHTFMLRNRGDSNGCVVFKDYNRFLTAFKRGEVTKLVVVAHMPSSRTSRIASLF